MSCVPFLEEVVAFGEDGGLGSVVDADLGEDALHVFLDRFETDMQAVGDLLVGMSGGNQTQDFQFPIGKRKVELVR